jgi:hypothetical protein
MPMPDKKMTPREISDMVFKDAVLAYQARWNLSPDQVIGLVDNFLTDESDTPDEEAEVFRQARRWLIDCFPDQEEEINDSNQFTIRTEIDKHYDGGWLDFVAAATDLTRLRPGPLVGAGPDLM